VREPTNAHPVTMAAQECAMETIAACRLEASKLNQMRIFPEYAAWLRDNAKAAERWLVRGATSA
jgi:hypothetical protein